MPLSNSFIGSKNWKTDSSKLDGDDVKIVVWNWIHQEPAEFYNAGIHAFICQWNTAIERVGENLGCKLVMYSYCLMCDIPYFLYNKTHRINFLLTLIGLICLLSHKSCGMMYVAFEIGVSLPSFI